MWLVFQFLFPEVVFGSEVLTKGADGRNFYDVDHWMDPWVAALGAALGGLVGVRLTRPEK
jgi:hypothetical protein